MKLLKFVLLLCLFPLLSCSDEEDITINVFGTATATPSRAKNGEKIVLSVGGMLSGAGSVTIKGHDYHAVIHYLIDDVEVATSLEKENPFNAEYVVTDLAAGEHTLSVVATPSRKNAIIENNVKPSTISITE